MSTFHNYLQFISQTIKKIFENNCHILLKDPYLNSLLPKTQKISFRITFIKNIVAPGRVRNPLHIKPNNKNKKGSFRCGEK